jgi:hypothetical protein
VSTGIKTHKAQQHTEQSNYKNINELFNLMSEATGSFGASLEVENSVTANKTVIIMHLVGVARKAYVLNTKQTN